MNSQLLIACAFVASALASDFRVTVGISQITGQVGTGFDPNRIVPVAGDTITFTWLIPSYINDPQTGTYSVTQGSIGSPCQPLSGGFDSGPHTTGPESAGQAPTMTFNVKDTQPLYFYSSVGDTCKAGMVLGVNTPASGAGSVESYITAAGGNPNVDTTLNATSLPVNTTTTTTTPLTNSSTVSTNTSTSTTSKTSTVSSAKNSSASARAQSSPAVITGPQAFGVLASFLLGLLICL